MKQWYSGEEPPGLSGGGGGGVEQGPGTAIANNKAVRGDTTGIQGSSVTISDTAEVTCGGVLITPNGGIGADQRVRIEDPAIFLAFDVPLKWSTNLEDIGSAPDVGIERQAAGALKVTNGTTGNGNLMIGGSVCRGFTTSAGAPGTTQFPNDKDWGFHRNSGTGDVYVSFNDGGVIVSVVLAEII